MEAWLCLLHLHAVAGHWGMEASRDALRCVGLHCFAAFQAPYAESQELRFVLDNSPVVDARRQQLIASLRQRFRLAQDRDDSRAKQELFREAIYLGIQPHLFTDGL